MSDPLAEDSPVSRGRHPCWGALLCSLGASGCTDHRHDTQAAQHAGGQHRAPHPPGPPEQPVGRVRERADVHVAGHLAVRAILGAFVGAATRYRRGWRRRCRLVHRRAAQPGLPRLGEGRRPRLREQIGASHPGRSLCTGNRWSTPADRGWRLEPAPRIRRARRPLLAGSIRHGVCSCRDSRPELPRSRVSKRSSGITLADGAPARQPVRAHIPPPWAIA